MARLVRNSDGPSADVLMLLSPVWNRLANVRLTRMSPVPANAALWRDVVESGELASWMLAKLFLLSMSGHSRSLMTWLLSILIDGVIVLHTETPSSLVPEVLSLVRWDLLREILVTCECRVAVLARPILCTG